MSSYCLKNIECERCSHQANYKIFDCIDVQINPELKECVKNGDIFKITYSCGNDMLVLHSFLYIAPKNTFKLQLCSE